MTVAAMHIALISVRRRRHARPPPWAQRAWASGLAPDLRRAARCLRPGRGRVGHDVRL